MDIAASGIKERFSGEGYSPAGFVSLAARLVVAFAVFWGISFVRVGWKGIDTFASMWLMFSLFSVLLAVLGNGFGWRQSHPRFASSVVRFGVFGWLLAGTAIRELQPHFHASPMSQIGVAMMLVAALIVGGVVDAARLGRPARAAIRS